MVLKTIIQKIHKIQIQQYIHMTILTLAYVAKKYVYKCGVY